MASKAVTIKNWRTDVPGVVSENRKVFHFPKVMSVNEHGKPIEWQIGIRLFRSIGRDTLPIPEEAFVPIEDQYFDNAPLPDEIHAWIKVDAKVGPTGKIRDSFPTLIASGKNKGRANQTNVFCQALRDALGLWNKQMKKARVIEETSVTLYPPMLATVMKDLKKAIDFGGQLRIQRKYNGLRAEATYDKDKVIMYSRNKHLYKRFQYIKDELAPALKDSWDRGQDIYLDGEIYLHGKSLQEISGYARREDEEGEEKYHYMIYDMFIPSQPLLTFTARNAILEELFANFKFVHTIKVETIPVHSAEEIGQWYNKFVDESYEGAMVRLDAPYRYSWNGHRSTVLLKIKPTLDAQYMVVNWQTGEKGKAADALMIVCTTGNKEFSVTPALDLPVRVQMAQKMKEVEANGKTHFENNYLGKMIRVYYDELSQDQVPLRARTKLERMGIDIMQ